MRKMKITSREIIISTIGSLGASFIIWFLGIIAAAIIAATNPTGTIFSKDGFNWSWETLKTLLCIPIPMWAMLSVISAIAIIIIVCRTLKRPPFLKERESIVGGLRRTWEWEYDNETKRYMVIRLKTYCPECGSVLTCSHGGYDCINGHHYNTQDVGFTVVLDAIVNNLQNQYPKYRDLISRHHTLYG